jgi:hypothetical protein
MRLCMHALAHLLLVETHCFRGIKIVNPQAQAYVIDLCKQIGQTEGDRFGPPSTLPGHRPDARWLIKVGLAAVISDMIS